MSDSGKSKATLARDLSDPVPVPEEGIERAVEIMRNGRIFRYGEFEGSESEVALLEREFAELMGSKYAVALNSCGCAMFVALKSVGVQAGDNVIVNGFTLAPVPGAIAHAGAKPLFVECADECRIDLHDLEIRAAGDAKVFLLSHMRGHIADMERIRDICTRHGVVLIEDCAHTLGARWNGRLSGSFGEISCFSLQSFKHINAGKGGVLTTDDEDIAARAILYSGSYMLYAQHGARPELYVFDRHKYDIPNLSMRMHEVTAAMARPQLARLPERVAQWAASYTLMAELLEDIDHVQPARRLDAESFVGSSIQFFLSGLDAGDISRVIDGCRQRGVDIKWFGRKEPVGFTSSWQDWQYVEDEQTLPHTREMLDRLCDMRIPIDLSTDEARCIAEILSDEVANRA